MYSSKLTNICYSSIGTIVLTAWVNYDCFGSIVLNKSSETWRQARRARINTLSTSFYLLNIFDRRCRLASRIPMHYGGWWRWGQFIFLLTLFFYTGLMVERARFQTNLLWRRRKPYRYYRVYFVSHKFRSDLAPDCPWSTCILNKSD